MTTTTKPRKSVKPQRSVQLSRPVHGRYAVLIMLGRQQTGYYLEPLPADFGLAFRFEKFSTCRIEGEPDGYDVLLNQPGGGQSCECKGFLRWGHCKHIDTILDLVRQGRLAPAAAEPQNKETVEIAAAQPKPRYCRMCGHLDSEHVAGFCLP
jgi:hypothetical protein